MKKILLIERDQMIRENISYLLSGMGFTVHDANNVSDALMTVDKIDFDIVISGISSGCQEFELCRALKANNSTASIPLVYITSDPKQIQLCMQLGVDGFLPKPFTYDQLLETVLNYTINYYKHNPSVITNNIYKQQ